jgi:hypothetical protein
MLADDRGALFRQFYCHRRGNRPGPRRCRGINGKRTGGDDNNANLCFDSPAAAAALPPGGASRRPAGAVGDEVDLFDRNDSTATCDERAPAAILDASSASAKSD